MRDIGRSAAVQYEPCQTADDDAFLSLAGHDVERRKTLRHSGKDGFPCIG